MGRGCIPLKKIDAVMMVIKKNKTGRLKLAQIKQLSGLRIGGIAIVRNIPFCPLGGRKIRGGSLSSKVDQGWTFTHT